MLRPVQPYVEYVLNQDYIVEFLCSNKEKPELQCNGKCYLAKQLEKQDKNNTNSLKVSLENYPIGFVNIVKIRPYQAGITTKKTACSFYKELYHFMPISSEFQPPDFA